MKIHRDKENALLHWINHLNVDDPVRAIKELHDGVVLMKVVYKLRKEEPPKSCVGQPVKERLKLVSDFLQGKNECKTEQGAAISWDNITDGINLEVELSKVVVLLLYHSVMNSHIALNGLEPKFEVELASMLRFVLENENSLFLSKNLEKYLQKKLLFSLSSDVSSDVSSSFTSPSASVFSDNESPVIHRKKGTRSVQFLDLNTVASSSVSSPLQEVMNTPQFQLKKLQTQLRQERDMRDELEKDLASSASALDHRESQICQLQFRIEKLLREKAEQEQEPRDELRDLLSKNEGLRSRLHEVLKQCQELKTSSSQMERKVDDLTEENGMLSSQMREVIARLASAEAEVLRLTEAQDLAKAEWSSRHSYLQAELSQAMAQKEFLTEQMLILQSKISSLEDELQKAQTQESGEVMGPIMEWEQLKEYECTIARLEGEREQSAALMQSIAQENQRSMEELQQQLRLAEDQFQAVQEQNKEMSANLGKMEETLSLKETRLKGLEEQLQTATSLALQRHQEMLALQEELASLKKEVTWLQEEVEKRCATEALAAEKAREKDCKVVELEMSVSDLQQQLGSAVQCIDAKSQDCERLEKVVELREAQLQELRQQEEATREEATHLRQEVSTNVLNLQAVQREMEALKVELERQQDELRGKESRHQLRAAELQQSLEEQEAAVRMLNQQEERARNEATLKMEALQAQMEEVSSLATAKDLQICTLREEATALQGQLAKQEQVISHQEELLQDAHREKESVERLREELAGQQEELKGELIIQQEKAAELQRSLKEEQEALRELKVKEAIAREDATRLCQEISTYVSHLEQAQKEKGELKEQEESARKEASLKMEALQAQMEEMTSLAAAKDLQLCTLREEATLLRQEISTHVSHLEQVQKEKGELKEQEERAREAATLKMEALQAQMGEASSLAATKDQQLCTLSEEAIQLRLEISTHVSHLEQVQKENGELKEQEERARVEATLKMEDLQAQMEEVSSLAAAKDQQLCTLREEATALQGQLAKQEQEVSHQKELLQEAHKEKELVETLREELVRQEKDLKGALTIQEEKAADLQKSLKEAQEALSALNVKEASAREEATRFCQEISTHVRHLEEMQKEKEALQEQEERAREEATLKMEALQAQIEEVSSLAAALELHLCTLREEAILLRQENTKQAADLEVAQREKVQLEGLLSKEHTALHEQLSKQQEELKGEVSLHQQKATELQQILEAKDEALRGLKEQLIKQQEDCCLQKEELQVSQSVAVQQKEAVEALRLEMSLHEQRAADLQQSFEEKEAALKELEERAREEAIRLNQEISTNVNHLQQVQKENGELKEQQQSAKEEATQKIQALQAQIEEVSSLATARDQQLCTLREEATRLRQENTQQAAHLEEVQREKVQLKGLLSKEHTALNEQLAMQLEELRGEVSLHQQSATELQQSLEEKEAALKELREQEESIQNEASQLRQEISTHVSHLEQVQKEKEELKEQEERAREEALQAQTAMSCLAAAKDLQLCTLREEATLLHQEVSMHVRHLEEAEKKKIESEGLLRKENIALLEQNVKQKEEMGMLLEVQSAAAREREELARQREELREELSVLQQEKKALLSQVLQAKQIQTELEGSVAELQAQRETSQSEQRKQLDTLLLEKQRLLESNEVLERKCNTAQRLEAVLQEERAFMQERMDGANKLKTQNHELQQLLTAQTEVVEHYKAQMEKAKTHYSGKKQQLVKVQAELTELQRVVEVKEHAVDSVTAEMKLLQKELEKARSKENLLSTKVNTLKAQLAFADCQLREKPSVRMERGPGRMENAQSRARQETSRDSLDLSLDDSLNTTTRPSLPEESSTPLVRSSERLAAKRQALGQEGSLETLFFTPMNTRQINRTSTERRLENSITSLGDLALDSAKRPPTTSTKRRRTTQVVNITMSKKTPGRGEAGGDSDNETFYTVSSARSHPNNTRTHNTRPSSMDITSMPGIVNHASSDQLLHLPGYRRSTIHAAPARSTSQFCVGAENEPEHAVDDWVRIAELQARNQACLPHLKSSYPLESRPSLGPSFSITDDDLRTGDPSETIRRASMMPGQIQESLQSHRLSLHLGQVDRTEFSGPAYSSHRLSLMPQNSNSTLSHQNTQGVRTSTLKRSAKEQQPDTPEAKRAVTSCFPRPLTPKGGYFGTSNNQNRQIKSPSARRQSMAFSIDNTPQKAASKSGFIRRGMNKIRNSARKSPAPATRRSPGNTSSRVSRSGAAKSPCTGTGSGKSPQLGGKAQRKSPRTNNSKSPKIPSSARKMMNFKMKV
uniref:Nuclear mitotic apparatus protein 1 N-terminal hook domain-containing protein n=1 Tax=Esox lucius TaxID=8010 RepID=A0AAY5KYV0_ESOLU